MYTPASVYVYEAVPSSHVLRARTRAWLSFNVPTYVTQRTHARGTSRGLTFRPAIQPGPTRVYPRPGPFFSFVRCGNSCISLSSSFSLSSSQHFSIVTPEIPIFFPSFLFSVSEGTRRWFPHLSKFLLTYECLLNRDRKLYQVLTFSFTTYLACRFVLRFRLCIP